MLASYKTEAGSKRGTEPAPMLAFSPCPASWVHQTRLGQPARSGEQRPASPARNYPTGADLPHKPAGLSSSSCLSLPPAGAVPTPPACLAFEVRRVLQRASRAVRASSKTGAALTSPAATAHHELTGDPCLADSGRAHRGVRVGNVGPSQHVEESARFTQN